MPSIVKILRVVADPNRLRILLLLKGEELSVAELQEILVMGQSTISTHLSQLKQAGLVEDRRTGKSSLYRLASGMRSEPFGSRLAGPGRDGDPRSRAGPGRDAPRGARSARTRCAAFFDSVAGRLGKDYVPGKVVEERCRGVAAPDAAAWSSPTWARAKGAFALLLAQRAKRVIAVDSSAKMIEVGREQALPQWRQERRVPARRHGRTADRRWRPSILFSFRNPCITRCIRSARCAEAGAILAPGGRMVILDLVKHRFEEARELYADEWLGFSEAEMEAMLEKAGFIEVGASVVDKEPEAPQFQTLLAVGRQAR